MTNDQRIRLDPITTLDSIATDLTAVRELLGRAKPTDTCRWHSPDRPAAVDAKGLRIDLEDPTAVSWTLWGACVKIAAAYRTAYETHQRLTAMTRTLREILPGVFRVRVHGMVIAVLEQAIAECKAKGDLLLAEEWCRSNQS